MPAGAGKRETSTSCHSDCRSAVRGSAFLAWTTRLPEMEDAVANEVKAGVFLNCCAHGAVDHDAALGRVVHGGVANVLPRDVRGAVPVERVSAQDALVTQTSELHRTNERLSVAVHDHVPTSPAAVGRRNSYGPAQVGYVASLIKSEIGAVEACGPPSMVSIYKRTIQMHHEARS
eukprot:3170371-Prymnesium_polylepis.3